MPQQRTGWRPILNISAIAIFIAAAIWSAALYPPRSLISAPAEKACVPQRAIGAMQPRLSPDGKDIVFSYHGSIWRMPAEGGVMRRLAGGAGLAVEPCWSPGGKRIAFLQGRGWGSGELKLIDAATGAPLPLKDTLVGAGKIAFSSDGARLYGHLRTEKQPDTFRSLDLNTGELKTLVRQKSPRQPWALSSDGKWIVFITTMEVPDEQAGNNGPQVDVWKVASAGGEPERLVRFPARIYDLCWSGNDKALFVSTCLGGAHNNLWRLDLDATERPTKLTFGQADADRPSVSADGRWLLHTDNHEGCVGLVLRDLRGGDQRTIAVTGLDFRAATGRLQLQVLDEKGQPVAGRIALQHKDGSFHAPAGALWRVYRGTGHFYAADSGEFEVPEGTYRVRVFHGPEYRVAGQEVVVSANGSVARPIKLERWTDPNAKGWYCGDNHIHPNYGYGEYYNQPVHLKDLCLGENLNVCNFMVANSDGDGVFDREFFRGRPDPFSTPRTVLYWNEEWRSTVWGHMTLVNLKQVVEPIFTGFKDTTNPWDIPSVSDISARTRRQSGLVNYTHPSARVDDLYRGAYTAKGLPIYAALGKIDTMDAMGSNDQASSALYQRLLNCGFRLTASAGTDCFLNRLGSNPPGTERVYAKVKEPFSYAGWIEGLRAGRSFVTNGPMLELKVDDKEIGDVLAAATPTTVTVKASAAAAYPLTRLELLHDGKVIASRVPEKGQSTIELSERIKLEQSGWLGLRALGPAQPETKGESLYALTSPVYVTIAAKPAGSAEDARYFLEWIDRLWTTVQERDRIPDERSKADIRAEIEQARAVYRKIADAAAK